MECAFSRKKSRNDWRISADVMGGVEGRGSSVERQKSNARAESIRWIGPDFKKESRGTQSGAAAFRKRDDLEGGVEVHLDERRGIHVLVERLEAVVRKDLHVAEDFVASHDADGPVLFVRCPANARAQFQAVLTPDALGRHHAAGQTIG